MGSDLTERAAQAVAERKQSEGAAVEKRATLQQELTKDWVVEQVQKALGPKYDGAAYVRSVVSAIKQSPDLARCDPATVFGGMFTAAQMHLEIGGGLGQAFLIPRKSWALRENEFEGWQASFQIGYQGLIKLAYNTGLVTAADTEIVRDGDLFTRGMNSERGKFFDLEYGRDHNDPERAIKGVLGFFWARGAHRPVWRYLTLQEVEERRPDHTKEQSGRNGTYTPNTPWKTNYVAMVEKTGLINVLKFAPKSPHLALALSADDVALTTTPEAPDEVLIQREGEKNGEIVNLPDTAAEQAKSEERGE